MFYFCVLPEFSCPPSIRTFWQCFQGDRSRWWWTCELQRFPDDDEIWLWLPYLTTGTLQINAAVYAVALAVPCRQHSRRKCNQECWRKPFSTERPVVSSSSRKTQPLRLPSATCVSSLKEKLRSSNSFHLRKLAFTVDGLYLYLWY